MGYLCTLAVVGDVVRFLCSVCGDAALTVSVLEPGERADNQSEFAFQLDGHLRRLCLEVPGLIGWTSPRSDPPDEILRPWRDAEFESLRREDSQYTASYCSDCEKWYCFKHSPFEKAVDGAPMYDYHYRSICPEGHERTIERV